jgi:5-methylcytosine-specific restriction endonuclease McrA
MFNFFNKEIRYAVRTSGWSKLRKEHIKKQPCCMACGTKKELEVHHIIPVHLAPEFELNPNNLITLVISVIFL